MAATFNDDAERNFFVEHPFTKHNCLLYLQLLGETKRVNRIAPFLDEMRVQGLEVEQHMYCAAISACGDQVEAAMNLERDMIEGTERRHVRVSVSVSVSVRIYVRVCLVRVCRLSLS